MDHWLSCLSNLVLLTSWTGLDHLLDVISDSRPEDYVACSPNGSLDANVANMELTQNLLSKLMRNHNGVSFEDYTIIDS